MHDLSDKYLMMIEPTMPACGPVGDELTGLARRVFATAMSSDIRYRGFHVCVCKMTSDNNEWILPDGTITNSLMIHYVDFHRSEVPASEIEKLRRLSK